MFTTLGQLIYSQPNMFVGLIYRSDPIRKCSFSFKAFKTFTYSTDSIHVVKS
jgi:hypothetical protein